MRLRADDLSYESRRLRFHFSKHVLEELEKRQIPRMLVETILESPEQRSAVLENINCYQSRVEISGKQYVLRVLVNETIQPPVVITAYRTSKIRKYWKES